MNDFKMIIMFKNMLKKCQISDKTTWILGERKDGRGEEHVGRNKVLCGQLGAEVRGVAEQHAASGEGHFGHPFRSQRKDKCNHERTHRGDQLLSQNKLMNLNFDTICHEILRLKANFPKPRIALSHLRQSPGCGNQIQGNPIDRI